MYYPVILGLIYFIDICIYNYHIFTEHFLWKEKQHIPLCTWTTKHDLTHPKQMHITRRLPLAFKHVTNSLWCSEFGLTAYQLLLVPANVSLWCCGEKVPLLIIQVLMLFWIEIRLLPIKCLLGQSVSYLVLIVSSQWLKADLEPIRWSHMT